MSAKPGGLRSLAFSYTKRKALTTSSHPSLSSHSQSHSHPIISQHTSPTQNAHHLFDEIPHSDYTHLLFEHTRNGRNRDAINLFMDAFRSGSPLNGSILSSLVKACGSLCDQVVGRQVHCHCVKSGLGDDVSVGTALVDMYMKTEGVVEGRRVFDEMRERNVVTWTSLISGYAKNGWNEEALELFMGMQMSGSVANPFTYVAVLGALADEGLAGKGSQVHCMIVKNGYVVIRFVCNSLINMYLKSGMVSEARAVFDGMECRDEVTWNSLIAGYVGNGLELEAFDMFKQMGIAGIKFTQPIFVTVIKLCANYEELGFARQLHCCVLKSGFVSHRNIETALLVAYSKCRKMGDAHNVFSMMRGVQSVVTWTAMISGYLQNGRAEKAVKLFCEMSREGVKPNDFTYSAIIMAHPCISIFQVHAQVIKTNYEKSPSVGTSLVDTYVKIGFVPEAKKVFQTIDKRDIVAWSAMLAGYAQVEDAVGAIKTFRQLTRKGVRPNEFTLSSIINACSAPSATVEQGKQFHACSIKLRLNNTLCLSSALVTMYAKQGNIESANEVFKRQGARDLVSWNSMLSGYAQHGQGNKVLEVFEDMRKRNMEVDGITFILIISACTHAGLVDEDANVWRALLGACRVHRNLELGKLVAEKLISLQPQDSAAYVLLSNIYAAAGNWQERDNVRRLMNERKVKKQPGYSWIEVKNKTYTFLAGDISHPLSDRIYLKLGELNNRLKDMGYLPDTDFVLHDVEEEHKAAFLYQHSERLAIAFGLIAKPPGSPIQIMKNLRVCGDCHTVIKLISVIESRDIVVRDSNRYHHFKGGLCSCGDFW
ncbi:pentatricopeptide repeat-containing protein At2g27610 isoform X2 [Argentina anserina]|uniref:pentatricopeptide repeat-containing protein At2g27610 isoform X2 n=1 Tax=Argentina anserina TaxID=57926 RepID=UPI00217657A3|nr:pentatricopeptide repeat-containing protein At2g27610 isoform X2 [Potentilla anserina]